MTTSEERKHSLSPSRLIIIGSCLAILGCFLPWMGEGDLFFIVTPGISLHRFASIDPWLRHLRISDNGGVAIILISAAGLFISLTDYLHRHRRILMLMLSISNVLLAVYHIVSVLVLRVKQWGIIGRAQLMFGLPIVLVGTVIMLVGSARLRQQQT